MDCPNCKNRLVSTYAYTSKNPNLRGSKRTIDFLYCDNCKQIFKMKLEIEDSRPTSKMR